MSRDLDRLRVVMVGTRNPLNLGAAARAMSNFGARHLRVVNPWPAAYREARSAMGGADVLQRAEEHADLADAIADCSLIVGTTSVGHRELQHPLLDIVNGARRIRRRLNSGKVALLFGSEKVGLSNADLSYCHWLMRIPTRDDHGSMNLGQAVALCLYELVRNGKVRATKKTETAAVAGDVERITELLFEALQFSGYVKPRTSDVTREKVRRLLRRLRIDPEDTKLWLGMLRQIAWKLGTDKKETTR